MDKMIITANIQVFILKTYFHSQVEKKAKQDGSREWGWM